MLSNYEVLNKPINKQITSQGYCYEILIYASLLKQNVTHDDIDTYLNILTELSYFFFLEEKDTIDENELSNFLKNYKKKYYLTISSEKIFDVLHKTKIFLKNNFGARYFNYRYTYYFFVARYMSKNLNRNEIKTKIKNIIDNLHNDNNAYITIFLVHHSSDSYILEEILKSSKLLFNQFSPTTLSKQEMKFFDEQRNTIIKACLPSKPIDFQKEREKSLERADEVEENNHETDYEQETELAKNLRRSIRTVETMG